MKIQTISQVEDFIRNNFLKELTSKIGLEGSLLISNDFLEVLAIKEVPSVAPIISYLADEELTGRPRDLISAKNSCYFYGGIKSERLNHRKIPLTVDDFAFYLSLTYSLLGEYYSHMTQNTGDILASFRYITKMLSNTDPKILFLPERDYYNPTIIN